jgi:hypothetical protein
MQSSIPRLAMQLGCLLDPSKLPHKTHLERLKPVLQCLKSNKSVAAEGLLVGLQRYSDHVEKPKSGFSLSASSTAGSLCRIQAQIATLKVCAIVDWQDSVANSDTFWAGRSGQSGLEWTAVESASCMLERTLDVAALGLACRGPPAPELFERLASTGACWAEEVVRLIQKPR